MKKCLAVLSLLLLLSGCGGGNPELNKAMEFRKELITSEGCSFDAEITADYGDAIHTFTLACQGDSQGNLTFTVTEPQSIGGITGKIGNTGGQLTYTETALQFDLLTDQQLSPVSAPWVFLKTLREGYLLNAGKEDGGIRMEARDSYEEDALHVDLWLSADGIPRRGEILFRGRRLLTLETDNFTLHGGGQV